MSEKKPIRVIESIDSIPLSKRIESRRAIYIGEKVPVQVEWKNHRVSVDLFDLSPTGTSFLYEEKSLEMKEELKIRFHRDTQMEYAVPGKIAHKTEQKIQGKSHTRYGVQFEAQYASSVEALLAEQSKDRCFLYKSPLRPHVFAYDPFFFQETLFFTVQGVFASGLLLGISTRCKSILPHSVLSLSSQVPGRSEFVVKGTVQPRFCFNRNMQFFIFTYDHPPVELLHAISEHIVLFGADAIPQALRQGGFQVGKLDHAFHLMYTKISPDLGRKSQFSSAFLGTKEPTWEAHQRVATRSLLCKLGPHVVGCMGLHFVKAGERAWLEEERGHESLPAWIKKSQYIEIIDFYMNDNAKLVDFFLSLLKQVVRIGAQSQSHVLLIECAPSFKNVLVRVGFEEVAAHQTHVMALPLEKLLQKDKKIVGDAVWNQMYRDLMIYLAKRKVSQQ